MTEKTIEQLKKEQSNSKPEKNIEKSISDTFMEELDSQENEIFQKIKDIRINTCEYEEFEAVTEDSLDDYVQLITYVKNNKLKFEDNGVVIKVRRDIKTDKGEFLTNEIKLLYERNEARERAFTKKIKVKKDDTGAAMDYTKATIAACLENVSYDGRSMILTSKHLSKMHQNDYSLLVTCFNFFRN